MSQQNKVQVFSTQEALSEAAARFIIDTATHAVTDRGRFVISLSGGSTPKLLFELLATPQFKDELPWKNTFIFWGDERCVPADDKDNNAHMARQALLDHIDMPAENIYPIPVDVTPGEGAVLYEKSIKDLFGSEQPCFDLILLGLGENGHTASLFPGTDILHEQERLVKEVFVTEQNMFRISMTVPLINKARNIIFLVAGEGKATVLNTILSGTYEPDTYPAQMISPVDGNLYWYTDEKAASLLPNNIKLQS